MKSKLLYCARQQINRLVSWLICTSLLFGCMACSSAQAEEYAIVATSSDDLPPGAIQRFGSNRFRVAGGLQGMNFSADGSSIYGVSNERLVAIDRKTGREIRDVRLHPGAGAVGKLAVSPDGSLLAVAMNDTSENRVPMNRIVVLDPANSRRRIISWDEQGGRVRALGFSPDQKRLFASTAGTGLRFWDLETGELMKKPTFASQVSAAAFSPDGQVIAIGGQVQAYYWNWLTDEPPQGIRGLVKERPLCVTFSPNGKWFVVAFDSLGGLRVFDGTNGQFVWAVEPNKRLGAADQVAFTPDGRSLAVPFTSGGDVEIWDLEARECIDVFPSRSPTSVAISRDGRWLAVSSTNGSSTLDVWDLANHEQVSRSEGHECQVDQLEFTSGDSALVSASADGTVRVWDAATGKQRQQFDFKHANGGPHNNISALAVSADSNRVIALAMDDTIAVLNCKTGQREFTLPGHGKTGNFLHAVRFLPDGDRFVSWGPDCRLNLWDATNGQLISKKTTVVPGFDPIVNEGQRAALNARMTADAKTLVIGFDNQLFDFDLTNDVDRKPMDLDPLSGEFTISPDGQWLVTVELSDWDPKAPRTSRIRLTIRDRVTLKIAHEFIDRNWPVVGLTFSADSRWLAYSASRETIDIIDVKSGRLSARIRGMGTCRIMKFSNDGKRLATVEPNHTIVLWDLEQFAVGRNAN